MTAPAPLPSDLIQQPRTPISGNGKQLVTLADVWNAALLQSIAHTWNVTAEYPTDLYIPRRAWMQTTAALLRREQEPTPAGSYFVGETGTRAYVSGGEVVELDGHLIDPDEPSDEEIPYI